MRSLSRGKYLPKCLFIGFFNCQTQTYLKSFLIIDDGGDLAILASAASLISFWKQFLLCHTITRKAILFPAPTAAV